MFAIIVMVVMGPVFAAIVICGPAILLVYGIGGATGLTAAWAELEVCQWEESEKSSVKITSV